MSSLRIASTTSAVGAASLSIAKPTGAAAGDVVLVFATATCASGTAAVLGTMSGWTATANTQGSNTSFAARGYAIVLTGSESWPFAITSNGSVSLGFIADYIASGFDPSTLVAPLYSNGSATPTASSITLASSGDWLAWFGVGSKNGAASSNPVTIPTGFANATDSGLVTNALQGSRGSFGDLETAQASGATGTKAGSITSQVNWGWMQGLQLGTSGSATLTVPGMVTAAPLITPTATAQNIPLTVDSMTLAAPLLTPQATAQVVSLTTPQMALAAPLLTISKGVGLTTPNMVFAAPAVNPQPTAQAISLTTPHMTFSAPLVSLGVSTTLFLTTNLMSLQAFPVNPTQIAPVYINPWYANQLDPLDSDFEGPTVP
jgi:hypothetical protein